MLKAFRFWVACFSLLIPAIADAKTGLAAFTVRDSIAMQRIVSPEGSRSDILHKSPALFSPDGTRFIVRTVRGELTTDRNVEQILLWESDAVDGPRSNRKNRSLPAPRTLIARSYLEDDDLITSVVWLDNRTLGFIAGDEHGIRQAYALDVETGQQKLLSRSKTDVASFGAANGVIVYFARMPSSLPPTSISTASHGIRDFLYWGDKDTSGNPLELYVVRDGKTEAQKVATAPIFLLEPKIWISPDGRHAITLAPAVNAPASWEAYRVWDKAAQGWTADRRSSDPTSELLYDRLRYQLVDLVKMEARPLFDAPEATLAFNRAPHFVAWLPGGTEVIISHSYLPLGAVSSEERQRRVSAPAIAQVNVLTGKARAIAWEPLVTAAEQKEGRQADRIVDVAWDAGARELRIDTEPPGKLKASTYYALDRHWEARRPSVSNAALALKVELEQNIHAPPILVASGGACHCRRMIYDPAPELAKLSLGRAEEFSWIDEKGRPWKGALLYPVGYRQGKRYPLVIQPHGYSPQEFLFDGPGGVTSAFAGQPLANAGIMVLQAGEIAEAITDDRNEGIEVANAWAAAIRELDRRGLIDIGRVGIIGWSRTGYHVAAMMALHPNLVRAATISDAIQYNYTQQMFAAADPLSEEGIKRVTGRSPVETGYGRWFDSNVFYGLSRSPAALRVEAYGLGSLISLWETYAISKQSGHTAELIYFPKGGHILQKPSERLSSQQGNVDWFEKWLLKSASGIK